MGFWPGGAVDVQQKTLYKSATCQQQFWEHPETELICVLAFIDCNLRLWPCQFCPCPPSRYSVNVRGFVWSIHLPLLCLFSSVPCCCIVAPCGSITDYYQSWTLTGKKSHSTKARIVVVFTLACRTCLECHCYWHFYWSVSCWHQQVSCHIYSALVSLKKMLPLCPLHYSLL